MRFLLSCLFAFVLAAPAAAQSILPPEPELPRTLDARPLLKVTSVDGAVKVERHFYRAGYMASLLAGAFQGTAPVIRVLGVGFVGMDISTPTLAEAQAQGYRAYLPSTATTGTVVTVTCADRPGAVGVPPFVCKFPLSQIQSQLTASGISLAATAFTTAADGERESARAIAPFLLAPAGQAVGPTGSTISILRP